MFLVIFLFRFVSINSQPAPPSADLAGDLIVLHTYTQQNPVFPYFKYEAPPLYYFIIVFPFTTIFGNLMGMKIIDSFVPSLLIFPFYFFCKLITKDRLASIIGASLFSFSEAFNEMLGWGGTFNMFAFVFAIASFYYLLRLVREGKTRDSLLLGLFLSLTVGTHNLTAVYVGLATILTFMLSFVAQLRLLPSTRAYLIAVLVAGVLCIPYIPYYLY